MSATMPLIMQHYKKMLHNSFCVLGHSVCSNRFTSTEEDFHIFSLLWSYLTFKNYLNDSFLCFLRYSVMMAFQTTLLYIYDF